MGITICMIPACLIPDNLQTNKPQARSSWWLLTCHPAWWYLGAASGDTASGSTGSRICRTGDVPCDDTLTDSDVFRGWVISNESGYKFAPSGTRWSHHHTRGHGTTPGANDSQTGPKDLLFSEIRHLNKKTRRKAPL